LTSLIHPILRSKIVMTDQILSTIAFDSGFGHLARLEAGA